MSTNTVENSIATSVNMEQSKEAIEERSAALATLALTREEERSQRENDGKHEACSDILNLVKLRLGGEVFEVEKETLLKVKDTYFHGLLSSGAWQPDADGVYYIDGPALGFGRILEYLSSGKLSFKGLTQLEVQCVYDNLDYFLIPYRRHDYKTQTLIDGFKAVTFCELSDGRLCGTYGNDIIVWNLDTNAIEMTLIGHTSRIRRASASSYSIKQVIQLQDGRVCSCSDDTTIKLWNVSTGLCELTLTGHSREVKCMIQLFDGRICSGAWDKTVRVWNVSTGVCEMTLSSDSILWSIAQLADGRICCGAYATISIYSLQTGECKLSWNGHNDTIHTIVNIDATRICSCAHGNSPIKVWNTATGECERTLEKPNGPEVSMVLMHDGRLSIALLSCTLMLCAIDSGKSEEKRVSGVRCLLGLHQLADGRLLLSTDATEGLEVFILS